MSKYRVLSFKPQLRLERRGQHGQSETEQPDHSTSLGDSNTSSTRIRFSVHTTGSSGVGASLAGIVSQRWDWGTIHLNAETALTRDHHADVFLGGSIEGPSKWPVRPVAEVFYEKEFGQSETVSALIGLIWRVRDDLSFDVGLRHALKNGHPVNEIRAGLTFGIPLQMLGERRQQGR
ncbi:hypothetical protein SAMN05443247_05092 [Bradyrhizobium erythrophlei]|jgi:hypothetical protein|nr:hypothetical protein SAMN05443247_05092 [Bradyrhizobium erythrophlei]